MKRIFDLFSAGIAVVLLLPIFSTLVVCIVFLEGFPVFFKQQRSGYHSKPFTLLKFRSMSIDKDAASGSFDVGSNKRVTQIGKFLRKTKLDELPQLINVLRGDMSIVGPRPEVLKWVNAYPERWKKVHTVRPGITDPASIVYRDEEEILAASSEPEKTYREEVLPHKLRLYENYINTHSFFGDIKIIFQTIYALFRWEKIHTAHPDITNPAPTVYRGQEKVLTTPSELEKAS